MDTVSEYTGETMYCPKCKRLMTPKPLISYEEVGRKEAISGHCPHCGSKTKKVTA